jgi:hypothetical protein
MKIFLVRHGERADEVDPHFHLSGQVVW